MVLDFFRSIDVFSFSVDDCKENASVFCDNFKASCRQLLRVLLGDD